MYAEAYLELSRTWWSFFAKITSFIIDAHLGSKCASDRRFTVEKVNRMSKPTSKFFHCLLVSRINKRNVGLHYS